jgi:quinol monooxygenase YgiN
MADGEIVVVAVAKAKEGSEETVEQALRSVIRQSHQEEGCVRYALHRSIQDPRTMVIVERWASQADLDGHFTKPYMGELMSALSEHVEGPATIVFTQPLPEGDAVKGSL